MGQQPAVEGLHCLPVATVGRDGTKQFLGRKIPPAKLRRRMLLVSAPSTVLFPSPGRLILPNDNGPGGVAR